MESLHAPSGSCTACTSDQQSALPSVGDLESIRRHWAAQLSVTGLHGCNRTEVACCREVILELGVAGHARDLGVGSSGFIILPALASLSAASYCAQCSFCAVDRTRHGAMIRILDKALRMDASALPAMPAVISWPAESTCVGCLSVNTAISPAAMRQWQGCSRRTVPGRLACWRNYQAVRHCSPKVL